jgi:hypothetical protein
LGRSRGGNPACGNSHNGGNVYVGDGGGRFQKFVYKGLSQ